MYPIIDERWLACHGTRRNTTVSSTGPEPVERVLDLNAISLSANLITSSRSLDTTSIGAGTKLISPIINEILAAGLPPGIPLDAVILDGCRILPSLKTPE